MHNFRVFQNIINFLNFAIFKVIYRIFARLNITEHFLLEH
jgi:hypothetical protein